MGYGGGGGGGGGGGSGGSGSGGSGAAGGSGYRRVGDDRTANLKVNNITNRTGTDGTEVDGVVEVNTTAHFIPPSGTTAERGSRGRGVIPHTNSDTLNSIDYITIATLGNARDFGDLTAARTDPQGCASSTRGIFCGGGPSTGDDRIEYITISSTGNCFNFGDLLYASRIGSALSSSTRGIMSGGLPAASTAAVQSQINYFTIASLGNASFFGDLTKPKFAHGSLSSPTRGIMLGGADPAIENTIEYITISTLGNAQDFGDISYSPARNTYTVSSSTRGIVAGGQTPTPAPAADVSDIDYVTIASLGDSIDFGELTTDSRRGTGVSNSIRGVFAGGYRESPVANNTMDYITIATTGNAADFGDLNQVVQQGGSGCSDSHGGLG